MPIFPDPNNCTTCTKGNYCPHGTATEPRTGMIPCPMGTYNPLDNSGHELNCIPCTVRFSCPSTGQFEVTDTCEEGQLACGYSHIQNNIISPKKIFMICLSFEGHYCPAGTILSNQFSCYPGTFTNRADLATAEECDPCPPGYYCTFGTSV